MLGNILGGIGDGFSFSNFFKKKEGSFLGLDIGVSAIKIVQLKKSKGTAVLETYGELSLGPYANLEEGKATNLTNKQISLAISDLLKESTANVTTCGVSIPLNSSLIFEMEIPKVSNEQLKKIVPIEARRFIPVPVSEVTLDWRIIPDDGSSDLDDESTTEDNRPAVNTEEVQEEKANRKNNIKVFVVAIHKNAVEKYRDIVKNAQLGLEFLEIEIFSTIRSIVDHNTGTVAVLDIGSGITKLYIVEYGIIRKSHIINRGSQDITNAIARTLGVSTEKAEVKKREIGLLGEGDDKEVSDVILNNLDYILEGTSGVLLGFQKEHNKNISKVIFTGGGSVIKGLTDHASKSLEIKSTVADPFDKIKTPAFLDDTLKEIGPEFAVAVGLALRGLGK
jgi:type IV pilus assembly protein PilM